MHRPKLSAYYYENSVGKEEIACNKQSPFPSVFSTLLENLFVICKVFQFGRVKKNCHYEQFLLFA